MTAKAGSPRLSASQPRDDTEILNDTETSVSTCLKHRTLHEGCTDGVMVERIAGVCFPHSKREIQILIPPDEMKSTFHPGYSFVS